MHNLLRNPAHVKHILIALNPHTGKWAVFLATDHKLINVPIAAGIINPLDLLCGPEEVNHPDAFCHEAGFVAIFNEDGTVRLKLRDLPRFPFPSSKPADFQAAIRDFDQRLQFHGIGQTDTVVLLWRPAQPGEITQQLINTLKRMIRTRDKRDRGEHDALEKEREALQDATKLRPGSHGRPGHKAQPRVRPRPHLRAVPTRKAEVEPASPALKLTLHQIPTQMLQLPKRLGATFAGSALYLLIKNFPAGKKGPGNRQYCDMGIEQFSTCLYHFKTILKKHPDPEIRAVARRMGTSERTVRRALARLLDMGLVIPVAAGKPGHYCTRRLVSRNEKERRENLPLARRVQENIRRPHTVLKPPGRTQDPGTDPEEPGSG